MFGVKEKSDCLANAAFNNERVLRNISIKYNQWWARYQNLVLLCAVLRYLSMPSALRGTAVQFPGPLVASRGTAVLRYLISKAEL